MCRNAIFVAWGPVHFVAYGFMFLLTLFISGFFVFTVSLAY